MIVIWILIGLIMLIVAGLLISPLTLEVDTEQGVYRLHLGGVGEVAIVPAWETGNLIFISWRLWFWKQQYDPVEGMLKAKEEKKPRKKTAKKSSNTISWPRIKRILRSFHVHYFQLTLDTNDPVWNAWLYPIAFWISHGGKRFSINYVQYNALRFKVSNRLIYMLRAWMF